MEGSLGGLLTQLVYHIPGRLGLATLIWRVLVPIVIPARLSKATMLAHVVARPGAAREALFNIGAAALGAAGPYFR